MQSIEYAVIAAAGMGSRLNFGLPKCLVEVNGRKIIEYQLELVKDIKQVRIVVGYKATDVIKFVKQIRDDVVFVHNPNYEQTTTLQSLHLGMSGIRGSALIMDGDTIFSRKSFREFLDLCNDGIPTIGAAEDITENPVYINVESQNNVLVGVDFQLHLSTHYEWANIALIPTEYIENRKVNVYEQLRPKLPIRVFVLERLEIDTVGDLEKAEKEIKENLSYSSYEY